MKSEKNRTFAGVRSAPTAIPAALIYMSFTIVYAYSGGLCFYAYSQPEAEFQKLIGLLNRSGASSENGW